jgi:hypothetical protein
MTSGTMIGATYSLGQLGMKTKKMHNSAPLAKLSDFDFDAPLLRVT